MPYKCPIKRKLQGVYYSMRARCYSPEHSGYQWYGGKGIQVCDEWSKLSAFINWALANGYEEGLQLDRIDANKDYSPDNCRWISRIENLRNRDITLYINGMVMKEYFEYLSIQHNIPLSTVRYRYYALKNAGIELTDDNIEEHLTNYQKYDLRHNSKGVDMSDKVIVRDEKGRIVTYYKR